MKRTLKKNNIHLIMCNLNKFAEKIHLSGIFDLEAEEDDELEGGFVHILPTLNDSLEYTESYFLESLYNQVGLPSSIKIESEASCESPRDKQLSFAAVTVLEGKHNLTKTIH